MHWEVPLPSLFTIREKEMTSGFTRRNLKANRIYEVDVPDRVFLLSFLLLSRKPQARLAVLDTRFSSLLTGWDGKLLFVQLDGGMACVCSSFLIAEVGG